jgi:ABC-type transport system substrate-binding protein
VAGFGLAALGAFLIWNAQSKPKGIVVAISNLPDSLNPVLEQNIAGMNASELVFDGLVNFEVDEQSGKLYPELALAESIEQDGTTKKSYTALLREVYWHDGSTLSAEDVVYSFAAYTDEHNNSPKRDYLMSFIERVTAIDNKTVKIDFVNPLPPFRAYPVLTFKIIPSQYRGETMAMNMRAGDNERNFAVEPVGTGPFRLTGWEIGKWLSFEANGAYFKRIPQATSLVLKKVIDPIIRMNELRKGRNNLILETSPMDRAAVAKMTNVDISSFLPYAFYQVAINTKLFPNADGRKAMSMAIDRPALLPSITDQKEGVVLNWGPFPSNLFSSNIPEYVNDPMPNFLQYNLSEARRLAETSGIREQTAILLYPDSMGEFGTRMAEGIVKQLAEIGLTVEAKRTGDQVFKRMVYAEKSYELALVYCDGFDNLYSSLGQWYGSKGELNITGLANRELDNLFAQWDKTVVTADWVKLTLKLNQQISDLAPAIYLCSLEKDVYSRDLKGVVIATDNPFLSVENWSIKE